MAGTARSFIATPLSLHWLIYYCTPYVHVLLFGGGSQLVLRGDCALAALVEAFVGT